MDQVRTIEQHLVPVPAIACQIAQPFDQRILPAAYMLHALDCTGSA